MQKFSVDKKKEKVLFEDQNKLIIYLVRFFVVLNIFNCIIFFLIFNNQDDALRWIWLIFAFFNLILFWYVLTKFSIQNELHFNEIESVKKINFLGLGFQLRNGKYRKIYLPRDSEEAQRLMKMFPPHED